MEQVTKEEALKYEKDALINGIKKREDNIKIFEDAISKEREEMAREMQMIAFLEMHEQK